MRTMLQNSSVGTMEAVAILLALPMDCILPKASKLVTACCNIIEEFAPKLCPTSSQSSLNLVDVQKEAEGFTLDADYQDRQWILIRECELLHKVLSRTDKWEQNQVLPQKTSSQTRNTIVWLEAKQPARAFARRFLNRAGQILINTARCTDHHGAMQRMSSVLETVSSLLLRRHTDFGSSTAFQIHTWLAFWAGVPC